MQLTTQFTRPHDIAADWLIVGVWEDEPFTGVVAELDAKMERQLTRLRERGDVAGKAKEITPLYEPRGIAAQRLLLIGLGPRGNMDAAGLFSASAAAARTITTKAYQRLAFLLPENAPNLDVESIALLIGNSLMHGAEGPGLR